ncbi:MAG: hypothetical protein LBJ63_11615, partial [Prevotellaceae bacterium]|nr:hypothetical protein [Prevotellaceae bacterium]
PGGGNGNPPAGDLKAGQVQIKGYAGSSGKKIVFYATAKKLTIDWGDGQKEEITPNGVRQEFPHEYENATNFQTISINTEDLTEIGVIRYYESSYNCDIRELRFGNCPKLKEIGGLSTSGLTVFEINKAESLEQLSIEKTDLTELNLIGCINLKSLNCNGNRLSATALNSLFTSLPVRTAADDAMIRCWENPGFDSCNISIAENKGWYVNYW